MLFGHNLLEKCQFFLHKFRATIGLSGQSPKSDRQALRKDLLFRQRQIGKVPVTEYLSQLKYKHLQ